MRYTQHFTITDDPYGVKLYEVYIMPCKLSVWSYVLGRHLTSDEIQDDELLLHMISQYSNNTQRDRIW